MHLLTYCYIIQFAKQHILSIPLHVYHQQVIQIFRHALENFAEHLKFICTERVRTLQYPERVRA